MGVCNVIHTVGIGHACVLGFAQYNARCLYHHVYAHNTYVHEAFHMID